MSAERVEETVKSYLNTLPKEDRIIEAAFFGGSFTGISAEKQEALLGAAHKFLKSGEIDGIRLSTRPDYISENILERLLKYGVTTVELGVQSMDNDVLRLSGRGHTRETVISAVALLKKYPFKIGLQMMTGLPGDTPRRALETARSIAGLGPDFVRIYPTLVLKDTYLEKMYKNGSYKPQSVSEAVDVLKSIMPVFTERNIPIIRVALAVTEEISPGGAVVAGPFHPAIRELAEGEIYFDKMCEILDRDKTVKGFSVNEKELSKAIGNAKINEKRIFEKYGKRIKFKPSKTLLKGEIAAWKE